MLSCVKAHSKPKKSYEKTENENSSRPEIKEGEEGSADRALRGKGVKLTVEEAPAKLFLAKCDIRGRGRS